MARTFGRRELIRGLGIGLVAAPFVDLLARPRSSRAADGASATRLVVFFSPNGTVPAHWTPGGGEADFTFAPGSILEPLEEIRDQLTIVSGLDFFGVKLARRQRFLYRRERSGVQQYPMPDGWPDSRTSSGPCTLRVVVDVAAGNAVRMTVFVDGVRLGPADDAGACTLQGSC